MLSFLLSIYVIFLLLYAVVMGFAVYKVFMFAQNKDLKGYSRRMTIAFLIAVLFIFFVSLLIIRNYQWNDGFSYYCTKLSPGSCICEPTKEAQDICAAKKKEAAAKVQGNQNSNQLPQT